MGVPKGYKHSEEALQKMREYQRSKPPVSEETRQRMRDSARAKFLRGIPDKTRKNISAGQIRRRRQEAIDNGIDGQEYDRQLASGNRWCSHCKQFSEAGIFDDANKRRCKACRARSVLESYYRNREGRRKRISDRYHANENGEKNVRRRQTLRAYSVTLEWYDAKLYEQNGGCAICGSKENSGASTYSFSVDHNHACCSGKKQSCGKCTRGLLCARCNQSIERIESIPDWATRAADYLSRYPLDADCRTIA